jgi:hypothetical protein
MRSCVQAQGIPEPRDEKIGHRHPSRFIDWMIWSNIRWSSSSSGSSNIPVSSSSERKYLKQSKQAQTEDDEAWREKTKGPTFTSNGSYLGADPACFEKFADLPN